MSGKAPSPALRAWLQARIAERIAAAAPGDWTRDVERDHRVLLIDGNEVELWFLGLDGAVFAVDRDSLMHRPEPVRDPAAVRAVLLRAAAQQPQLAELTVLPGLLSPDGRLRVRTHGDSRLSGYSYEEVTRLVVIDTATGATVLDMHLSDPGLQPVRFVGPRRVLLVADDGTKVERDLPGAEVAPVAAVAAVAAAPSPEVLHFDYATGRAGVVGMVAFGFAAAIAAVGTVALFSANDGGGALLLAFTVAFTLAAIFARTYTAHQELDRGNGEVRELRRWLLHVRHRRWPLTAFDRVQHWRGLNRGAPLFYLALEGSQRCLLLPRNRDPRALLAEGERIAQALGLPFRPEPIPDQGKPPR